MEQEEKTEGHEGLIGTIAMLAVIGIIVAIIACWHTPTNAEKALKSYQSAVKTCGADNVDEHEYTNGSKDFDCEDYSTVAK